MEKTLIKKCSEIFTVLADEKSLKITLSLAKEEKSFKRLAKDTMLPENELEEKIVDLVESNILRYKNDKDTFVLADAHVCALVRNVEDKANAEIFRECEF